MKKRIVSICLCICIILSLAGVAFGGEKGESNAIWEKSIYDSIKDGVLGMPAGTYLKVGAWAGIKLYNSFILGDLQKDSTKIVQALNEIVELNQQELLKLDELENIVKGQDMLTYINSYFNGDNCLHAQVKVYMNTLKTISESGDSLETQAVKNKNFFLGVLGDWDNCYSSEFKTLKMSEFDNLVLSYAEKIGNNMVILYDGVSTPEALMNNYCLQRYKWEHQGYDLREKYWASLMGLYLQAATLMRMSLFARIEHYEELNNSQPETMISALNTLNEYTNAIKERASTETVDRLPDNVRKYQVPGHEYTFNAKATKRTLPYLDAKGRRDFPCPDGRKTNEHWDSFYIENGVEGAEPKALQDIYNDYNPVGTTAANKKSLYKIMFDENEGNFEKPDGISEDCIFVTGDLKSYIKGKNTSCVTYTIGAVLIDSSSGEYVTWKYDGKNLIDKKYTLLAQYVDGRSDIYTYIPKEYCDKFVMVTPDAANDVPTEGDSPVYLPGDDENPQTSDTENITFWILLAALSGIVITVGLVRKKAK